jgi:hypothetical protein
MRLSPEQPVTDRSIESESGLEVVEISKYAFENLRTDGELNLYVAAEREISRPFLWCHRFRDGRTPRQSDALSTNIPCWKGSIWTALQNR